MNHKHKPAFLRGFRYGLFVGGKAKIPEGATSISHTGYAIFASVDGVEEITWLLRRQLAQVELLT